MINVVFLGPPGSGKGTQARFVHQKYGLRLVGMGDLLREEIKKGTPVGSEIRHIVESGHFPENELIISVLKNHLLQMPSGGGGYIFDGIPRDIFQAQMLDHLLKSQSLVLNGAIYLNVDDQILIQRVLQRYVCSSCGAIYGKEGNAPQVEGVCDWCGGKEFGRRKDDSADIFQQRLHLHKEKEKQVIAYYEQKDMLYPIDGTQDISVVQTQIESLFKRMGG